MLDCRWGWTTYLKTCPLPKNGVIILSITFLTVSSLFNIFLTVFRRLLQGAAEKNCRKLDKLGWDCQHFVLADVFSRDLDLDALLIPTVVDCKSSSFHADFKETRKFSISSAQLPDVLPENSFVESKIICIHSLLSN